MADAVGPATAALVQLGKTVLPPLRAIAHNPNTTVPAWARKLDYGRLPGSHTLSEDLRFGAIYLLGLLQDHKARPLLATYAYGEEVPPHLRGEAIRALANTGDRGVVTWILEQQRRTELDYDWRRYLAKLLCQVAHFSPQSADELATAARTAGGNFRLRDGATRALVSLGRQAVPAVLTALECALNVTDPDWLTVRDLVRAAVKIPDPRIMRLLVRLIDWRHDNGTRAIVTFHLLQYGHRVIPHLLMALTSESSERRDAAAQILSQLAGPRTTRRLQQWADAGTDAAADGAARTLSRMGTAGVDALGALMRSPSAAVRRLAAGALGRIEYPPIQVKAPADVRPMDLSILTTEAVDSSVLQALHGRARSILRRAKTDSDGKVRRIARESLLNLTR